MIKKLMVCLFVAMAGFGMGTQQTEAQIRMPGSGGQTQAPSGGDINAAQSALVSNFVQSYVNIATAQAFLMEALNEREQAAALRTQAGALSSGAVDRDAMRRATELSQEASATIQQRLAAGTISEAASVALFAQALPPLISGTRGALQLPGQASQFAESSRAALGSASMLERGRLTTSLATGTYLATNLPGFVRTTADTYRRVFTYANDNDISIPADGTDLLGSLN